MNDDIRRLITQTPFEEVRRFVAERATCGKCLFFDRDRCLNADISEFTTGEEFSPPDGFSCGNWLPRQPRTDIEAT